MPLRADTPIVVSNPLMIGWAARRTILIGTSVLIVTAGAGATQDASTRPRPAPLTTADIVTRIGSEADARAVVLTVLTHAMAQLRHEFFLAKQVRQEWLPVVGRAELVRVGENDIAGHLASCGTYWVIRDVERTGDVVSLRLG